MLRASQQIGAEHAIGQKELIRHLLRRRRRDHLQLIDFSDALIPAGQCQIGVVNTVIVVQVRQQEMVDLGCRNARLQEAADRTWTTVNQERLVSRLQQIAGTTSMGQGGWCSSTEKQESGHGWAFQEMSSEGLQT